MIYEYYSQVHFKTGKKRVTSVSLKLGSSDLSATFSMRVQLTDAVFCVRTGVDLASATDPMHDVTPAHAYEHVFECPEHAMATGKEFYNFEIARADDPAGVDLQVMEVKVEVEECKQKVFTRFI